LEYLVQGFIEVREAVLDLRTHGRTDKNNLNYRFGRAKKGEVLAAGVSVFRV
jgi:hypothetical protein